MLTRELRAVGADACLIFSEGTDHSSMPMMKNGGRQEPWITTLSKPHIGAISRIKTRGYRNVDAFILSDMEGPNIWRQMQAPLGRTLHKILLHDRQVGAQARRPYYMFIHGSEMRDLPFRGDGIGKKWRELLSGARHIFHCQPDLVRFARKLKLGRCTYVPTPIDTEYWRPTKTDRKDGTFTVLHPTWHGWGIKGNDVLIRAFAKFASECNNARLIIVRWQYDFGRSLDLVDSLGIQDRVEITGYMPPAELRRRINCANVVADSFALGVVGMIGLQAMACDRPAICCMNEAEYSDLHDTLPPVLNACDEDSILGHLRRIKEGLTVEGGREWVVKNCHPSVAAGIIKKEVWGNA